MKNLPDQKRLVSLLLYIDGKLYWKEKDNNKFWNSRYANKEAFTQTDNLGYKVGKIDGIKYKAHRIIWKLLKGYDPKQIDHIDNDKSNNKIDNLRSANNQENALNRKPHKKNTTGFVGVSFCKKRLKYRSYVKLNGKQKELGYFLTPKEAYNARSKFLIENGFTISI